MAKTYVMDNVPLSRFGVLVAQLESIVGSASQQSPDPLLCFDLLSDLITAIDDEPKESILLYQRKCEEALYSLVTLGARRPVRHLTSVAMAKTILKGDSISIYSRSSSLQAFLSDGKRSDPQRVAGAAQCLGELYHHFGRRITSGLLETTTIASKLMKFHEDFVRQQALLMLRNALEGCGGTAAAAAYSETLRLLTRFAISDKAFTVRIAAARCLTAFANIGGPGLGVSELDNLASCCVKGLEDPISSVRDAFAEALGSLLALGMNPDAQVQPRGKGPFPPAKKLEGGLQRHLISPFTKVTASLSKNIRFGLALSWVYFFQAIRIKHLRPDGELQEYSSLAMEMLCVDTAVDAHAVACVLYILRVGVTDQMMESTQRSFSMFLGKQLQLSDASPSMKIAALRTLSYTLKTLGEIPHEFKELFDDTVVAALSHSSELVRAEAALTLRALAEVDPTCVGGLTSYGVTTLNALRENVSFEKGTALKFELDSLHGQAIALAYLVSISPKLPLGYPARLPKSVLEVSKKMLTQSSRNLMAAPVEQEAGWLLLSSLLSSMPREELEDQVFDILSLWTDLFSGNPKNLIQQNADALSILSVWSAAIDALTAFIRRFVCSDAPDDGVLLQPVLLYLSRALSHALVIVGKQLSNFTSSVDTFVIRILIAYQSLPDPFAYKSEHRQIIELCTTPYRDPSGFAESSCLRLLLDKRDAWLGPWIPGRDWFEDELRYFQGGKDGIGPSVWENESSSFPIPETIKNNLVNQMLLCFGIMFASQDSNGMLSLLSIMEQCLKAGKKQRWRVASVTNVSVGLLAGIKALISLRPKQLGLETLNAAHAIFQTILKEGDMCASQRRAASEGLGLLARLGSDAFTARMTRLLLGELNGTMDLNHAGSTVLALGCIHHSAGGMALSTLVPATVSSISSLAKSSSLGLQIWALHGLLLTIEAAGLSFVSHVQSTLGLAMDILLSEESGWIDLPQGIGRLVNALVAVLGPELAPGSILFSRCKSVIAEISSWQETATLLESVHFNQQLVLFAPQAVPVHSHVQTLLLTMSSRQPIIRRLSVSTLRHLIEKDPVSVIDEEIEDNLFFMLDEETDSEIGNLIRATLIRLLYLACPSRPFRWISICRNMVLATSMGRNSETTMSEHDTVNGLDERRMDLGEDDEDMVSNSRSKSGYVNPFKDKSLRFRTRVFAAECLSLLPEAVGKNPAHFDLSMARELSGDWLILYLQEVISLAYQISTIQFESMRPIGVGLLSTIVDLFEMAADPELPGHILLEQYQAQLVSAVRTALDASSGPVLLEAGLQLATKIMTSGILSGDQVTVKRMFSLISRPLNEFKDLYYPSFAEWVTCKIKIRLLAAHASLKCYTFKFLRSHHGKLPDEYQALLPLFSKSSALLGRHWIHVLKDYIYICLSLNLKKTWSSFLDEIQSPTVSSKLQPCLEEAWPVILQALSLDAVPAKLNGKELSNGRSISGYSMVELDYEDYQFLWGFSLLVLYCGLNRTSGKVVIALNFAKAKPGGDSTVQDSNLSGLKLYEIVLPVFQSLSREPFFDVGLPTLSLCQELMQILLYSFNMDSALDSLSVPILLQIVLNCPKDFLENEHFVSLYMELCLGHLPKAFRSGDTVSPDDLDREDLASSLLLCVQTLMERFEFKMVKHIKSAAVAFLLGLYRCIRHVSTDSLFLKVLELVKAANVLLRGVTIALMQKTTEDVFDVIANSASQLRNIFGACLDSTLDLTRECIKAIHLTDNSRSHLRRLVQLKLAFCLEQFVSLAKLAHEAESLGDDIEGKTIIFDVLKHCSVHIQTAFTDSNLQVQATALQVLKSLLQRSTSSEDKVFMMFFAAELVEDIFTLMHRVLEKRMTKESVALVGECVRLLMLMHKQSAEEFQKGFMNLFLEAILMVFSSTSDRYSQEVDELRNASVRLVSHLAQIPASAVHFKDVLLSLPATQRQQLQDIIRASVSQFNNAANAKATGPAMKIKLPAPEGVALKDTLSVDTRIKLTDRLTEEASTSNKDVEEVVEEKKEEDDEDDDDWDTFQSFPASKDAAAGGSDPETDISAEESQSAVQSSSPRDEIEPVEISGVVRDLEEVDVRQTEDDAKDVTENQDNPRIKEEEEVLDLLRSDETAPIVQDRENETSKNTESQEDQKKTIELNKHTENQEDRSPRFEKGEDDENQEDQNQRCERGEATENQEDQNKKSETWEDSENEEDQNERSEGGREESHIGEDEEAVLNHEERLSSDIQLVKNVEASSSSTAADLDVQRESPEKPSYAEEESLEQQILSEKDNAESGEYGHDAESDTVKEIKGIDETK